MAKQVSCPSQQELQALIDGAAPADRTETFGIHLETCPDCAVSLDGLLSVDPLAQILRRNPGKAGVAIDADMMRMMEKLQHLRQSGGAVPTVSGKNTVNTNAGHAKDTSSVEAILISEPAAQLLRFLEKPQAAGELGRLGQYRVLKVLGVGGMGVVFHAEDTILKRPVALKAIQPTQGAAAKITRQRFLREAQSAARVIHENVVALHQAGESNGVAFLAMEFLQGEELEDRLARENILPLPEVLRIGREIALGLSAAHAQGLIHRDIKPANVFLVRGGPADLPRVKLLDFGVARTLEDNSKLTQSGMVVGTPSFMAPEQATGKTLDARCDLFSLGVVLYRMSTGALPFTGVNPMSVLIALAQEEPTPPQMVNFDLPGEVNELILRMLAKKPEDRPASALAVAKELEKLERQFSDPSGQVSASPLETSAPTAPAPVSAPRSATEPPRFEDESPRPKRGCLGMFIAAALLLGGGGAAVAFFLQ